MCLINLKLTFVCLFSILLASTSLEAKLSTRPGGWEYIEKAQLVSLKDNSKIHINNIRNELTVVLFWASWCDICKSHMLDLSKFIKTNTNKSKLTVIAISLDENIDQAKESKEFFNKSKLDFYFYFEQSGKLKDQLNISKIPLDLLFDKKNNLLSFHVGNSRRKYAAFKNMLKSKLRGLN